MVVVLNQDLDGVDAFGEAGTLDVEGVGLEFKGLYLSV